MNLSYFVRSHFHTLTTNFKVPDYDSTKAALDELEKRLNNHTRSSEDHPYEKVDELETRIKGLESRLNLPWYDPEVSRSTADEAAKTAKAVVETVEAGVRNHKGRLDAICDRLTTLEEHRENALRRLSHLECPSPWTLVAEKRLTALEAKASYKKIDALERRINTLMGSICALESKKCDIEMGMNSTLNITLDPHMAEDEVHIHSKDGKCLGKITNLEAKLAPEKSCERCGGEGKLVGEYGMMSHADGTCSICEGTGKMPKAKDAPKKCVLRQGGKVVRTFVDDPDTCGNCNKAWRQDDEVAVVCDKGFIGSIEYRIYHNDYSCPHYERREA